MRRPNGNGAGSRSERSLLRKLRAPSLNLRRDLRWLGLHFYKGTGRAKLTFGDRFTGARQEVVEQVILLGLDDVSLLGVPRQLHVGSPVDLRKPDGVIVDKVGLRKLFPGHGGEFARTDQELNWFLGREFDRDGTPGAVA